MVLDDTLIEILSVALSALATLCVFAFTGFPLWTCVVIGLCGYALLKMVLRPSLRTFPPTSYALITGASMGIGKEIAICCAKSKLNVILVARTKSKLEQLGRELTDRFGVRSVPISMDLSKSEAPQQLFDQVKSLGLNVALLVNNAGFGAHGAVSEIPTERQQEMIQVNVTTLAHLTRLFLPSMLESKCGAIMNLGSSAGFQPGPLASCYFASKGFVNAYSEGLSIELRGTITAGFVEPSPPRINVLNCLACGCRGSAAVCAGTGVTCTVVCPPGVETNFSQAAGTVDTVLFTYTPVLSAAKCAQIAFEDTLRGRRMSIPGLMTKMMFHSLRCMPRIVTLYPQSPWVASAPTSSRRQLVSSSRSTTQD